MPPSLQHRVEVIMSWVNRLQRYLPITAISQEMMRFDTQKLQNLEINGVEYQQGTLHGYEVREYLLEKWSRECAYCGAREIRLEINHIVPRSHGGSDRVSNLTLACRSCRERRGATNLEEFLSTKPRLLKKIQSQAKAPLKDVAAINSTRLALLNAEGYSIACGSFVEERQSSIGTNEFQDPIGSMRPLLELVRRIM